ncbi:MAG TPA: oxalate/formate MFS antiporter [Terriglobales bacterium]|nr:oxalate/formate MFS antiporter [Terriglobales bacterium]
MAGTSVLTPSSSTRVVSRWVQLIAGIFAMMAVANLQYSWTLFTGDLTASLHTTLPAIQVAFSTFLLAVTWLVPFDGYLIDRFGPRPIMVIAGVLVAIGWIGAGKAASVTQLVIVYTIGGIGTGIVYGGTIGNALKWFPDRRGLCVGLTSGAYGLGTALTVNAINSMIKSSGYAHTFIVWGFAQGIVVVLAALVMENPPSNWTLPGFSTGGTQRRPAVRTSVVDMSPWQMARAGSFWLIYLMMTLMSFGGLMVTAQLSPIAKFYSVDKVVVVLGMSALVLAIQIDRILNGLTRPFWGWVSDHLGRENTMFVAFTLEALAVFLLLRLADHPVWFIALSGLCFFAWGEIFSLFPSITADLFGPKWATTNFGVVLTGAGVASIFAGPIAAMSSIKSGNWTGVFWAMIACDIISAVLALFWLKPLAGRIIASSQP